ncbi:MAG: FUSC family protein [Acidobacteriaceae bacterium]|nr:FUSC family protein [Acidobacteriaceae bacterium]
MVKLSSDNEVLKTLRTELMPYPGRLAGSARDMLALILAIVLAETLRVPSISLSAALLLLIQRERPGLMLKAGIQVLLGCALASAASLTWVQATDGTAAARFLGVLLGIFIAAFCMAGTTLPLFWTIFGFYGFVDLAFWDGHHSDDAGVRYCLYNIVSFALVLACGAAVEYIFGTRHPGVELQTEMKRRISALEEFYSAAATQDLKTHPQRLRLAQQKLLTLVHAGDFRLNELHDQLRDTSADRTSVPVGLQYRIGILSRVLQKSVAFGFAPPSDEERQIFQAIAEQCREMDVPRQEYPAPPVEIKRPALREVFFDLQQYASVSRTAEATQEQLKKPSSGPAHFQFFVPGVFETPDTVLYALKLTLSAITCYTLYNAFAWPGILTCVVTVLFTGLNTTGAMKQKQLYRFSGAFIGGTIGIFTVSVFFPNMDSITSFVVLLAPVMFLAGWVMRSPRIGYVGVQIAFAFSLTTLPGFGPSTEISPARDRLFGISLGIAVLWLIFDQLWPRRASDVLQKALIQIEKATQQLGRTSSGRTAEVDYLRALVSQELANVQQLESASLFDIGRHRKREMTRTRHIARQIEAAAADFYQTLELKLGSA